MSTATKKEQITTYFRGLHVSWLTVGVFAVVLAYADGFWMTSLQGAIGAVERHEAPFQRWLRDSTLMLPLFLAAVVVALILARRWVGGNKRPWVKALVSVLLVVGFTAALGTIEAAASSAYDYSLQAKHIVFVHSVHHETLAAQTAGLTSAKCDAICVAKHQTMVVHFTAVLYTSVLLLITNLVFVVWLLAVRGGRLWVPKKSQQVRVAESPAVPAIA